MKKVVPSERLRRELDDVLAGIGQVEDPIEVVARRGARLILQQALEDEVTDFVGRGRHERAGDGDGVIYRNGFAEPSTVRTMSGPAVIERPRVRDATRVGFASRVLGKGVARTHALEALVVCSFLRGLSVRDVDAALEECFGEQVIGKSTVARVCKDIAARYAAWCERDLAAHDVVYCYLDAIYLKLRPTDEPAEGVLVAWGITLEGQKVLLGLQLGSRESYDSWLDFGRDLVARGMNAPAVIVADGAEDVAVDRQRVVNMEHTEDTRYETPRVADHGDLTDLTAGLAAGSQLDANFPAGTPTSQLTFSSPGGGSS